MRRAPNLVRCVECRHEYELPALGEEMGCPQCGGISWVSTRIAASPPPEPARSHQPQRA